MFTIIEQLLHPDLTGHLSETLPVRCWCFHPPHSFIPHQKCFRSRAPCLPDFVDLLRLYLFCNFCLIFVLLSWVCRLWCWMVSLFVCFDTIQSNTFQSQHNFGNWLYFLSCSCVWLNLLCAAWCDLMQKKSLSSVLYLIVFPTLFWMFLQTTLN